MPDRVPPASGTEITLLVAGENGSSIAARANLAAIVLDEPASAARVRVVDVLEQPDVALRYRAFFTPTLIVETPKRLTRVVGDLHDTEQLKRLLARTAD